MDLGTFREITKNLSDDTILYMSLAEVVKGDVIERDEIEADVENIEVDEDDKGRPFLWLLDSNDRKIIHASVFQKTLGWFGKHTIEEAVEILSTETNIIQKGKGEYDEKL